MKRLLVNTLLVLASLAAGLIVLEIAARIFFPLSATRIPAQYLADNGTRFVPNSSWSYQEPEFVENVTINSLGFRDKEIDADKPVLVFLGDSQTYGTGVDQGQRASDVVREMLPEACGREYAVLNVAMPGADTAQELAMLQHLLDAGVRIKRIYLLVTVNDHPSNHARLMAQNRTETAAEQAAPAGPGTLDRALSWIKSVRYRSRLVTLVLSRLQGFAWFRDLYRGLKYRLGAGEISEISSVYLDGPDLEVWMEATKWYIQRLKEAGEVCVVSVPDRYRYDGELRQAARDSLVRRSYDPERIDFDREPALLARACDELGVEYIDPADAFAAHPDPDSLAYPMNGHATPAGQRLLAEILMDRDSLLSRMAAAGCP